MNNHILGHQIVQFVDLDIESPAPSRRKNIRDSREPQVAGDQLAQERVIQCLRQPLDSVSPHPRRTENYFHAAARVSGVLT